MGCRGCGSKGRNRSKSVVPRLTKCNYCGSIDVPLPLQDYNKRGKKVICKNCVLKGIGM